jgi:hypothetical protein
VRVISVPAATATPYCAVSVPAWSLKSRDRRRVPLGQQTVAEEDHDGDRADHERDARVAELQEAHGPDAGIGGGLGDDDVHGRAGERQQ